MTIARDAFLGSIRSGISRDARMWGLWLVGSLGRERDVDEWSDIDVVCVIEDSALESWVLNRDVELNAFGRLLFRWDAPQNAFQPGYMLCSMFDSDLVPIWVDWHLQPTSSAMRPVDSLVLWERAPMPVSANTFSESLAGVRSDEGQPSLRHLADYDQWRSEVGMAYQALKRLGRAGGAAHRGRSVADPDGLDVIAAVEAVFDQHADHLPVRLRELLAATVERVR